MTKTNTTQKPFITNADYAYLSDLQQLAAAACCSDDKELQNTSLSIINRGLFDLLEKYEHCSNIFEEGE